MKTRKGSRAAFREWLEDKREKDTEANPVLHPEWDCACSACVLGLFRKETGCTNREPAWATRFFHLGSPEFPDSAGDDLGPEQCLEILAGIPERVRLTKRERETA